MDFTHDLIRTLQAFVSQYDNLIIECEKVNHCSVLIGTIPNSPTKNKALSDLIELHTLLTNSRLEAENLIRKLYLSICGTSVQNAYIYSIKEVSSRILDHLSNYLPIPETPSLTSIENSYDYPIQAQNNYSNDNTFNSPYEISDPFLDYMGQDPWPTPFEDLVIDDPIANTQRIALPPLIDNMDTQSIAFPRSESKSRLQEPIKPVAAPIHRKKKDDDDEYKGDDSVIPFTVKRTKRKTNEETRKIHQKPKWCHQCKARKRDVVQCCGEGKIRGANNQVYNTNHCMNNSCYRAYCAKCLKKHYGEDFNDIKKRVKKWLCPGCRDACSCAACVRKRYSDPRDIPENLQTKRNSRFFKTNRKLINKLTHNRYSFISSKHD